MEDDDDWTYSEGRKEERGEEVGGVREEGGGGVTLANGMTVTKAYSEDAARLPICRVADGTEGPGGN